MNNYLKRFVWDCKSIFKNDLVAIVLYGSHYSGLANKKSDYDIFILVNKKRFDKKELETSLKRKYNKISLQYYNTSNEIMNSIKDGHWSIYLALLKANEIIFEKGEYKQLHKKIKNYRIKYPFLL